jgi:cyclopropane fatty-acyl-phospholipid synthase-like methyltransferase
MAAQLTQAALLGRREPTDAPPDGGLVEYYTEAGPDMRTWSPGLNIHFGYYRRGLNPFDREAMLEQMNLEVYRRLERPVGDTGRLLDLGCGAGATARAIARTAPAASVTGVTLVPWQRQQAQILTQAAGLQDRVHVVEADYRALPWPDGAFDGAYAIESACHAGGADKRDFLAEAARVVKPGGRLVVADGFLKHDRPMNPILQRCYESMCRFWRVDECAQIAPFVEQARACGFEDVRVEEISWHIAPTVLSVPVAVVRLIGNEVVARRSLLTRRRWENVLAPLLGLVVGLARRTFGYYIVTARRG